MVIIFSVVENEGAITDSNTLDICNLNTIVPEINSIDVEALTPYISRGKLRTKERTILYNTPKNSQVFQGRSNCFRLSMIIVQFCSRISRKLQENSRNSNPGVRASVLDREADVAVRYPRIRNWRIP